MRKTIILLLVTVFVGITLFIPKTAQSIPAFARKNGFNCNMCHVAFTKLNDFGQRYRDNGYQIPGQEGNEKNVFETMPPISIRTSVGHTLNNATQETTKETTSGFHYYGFDLLAAGVLHKNVSFLIVYTPRVDVPTMDYSASQAGYNPSQIGALESANIVFSNIFEDKLNLRIGRFEPAYQQISAKRSLYLIQPYEIYNFNSPSSLNPFGYSGNRFSFSENQFGVEASSHFKTGFKYGLGIVNGTGGNPDNNTYKDIYLSLSQTIGKGDGQSAGQRIGIFAYTGWQPIHSAYLNLPNMGDDHGTDNQSFMRIGGHVSLNYESFNLTTLIMNGNDNKKFNDLDTTKAYTFTGGFVQLDYNGLMDNRLVLSGLYNFVTPPSYDNDKKISAISLLARYYLGDWTAVNVALHAEYTHRQTGKDNPIKEDILTTLVDFDF